MSTDPVHPKGGSLPSDAPRDPWSPWLLALAALVGLVRFGGLGQWSLWIDEIYTWGDSRGAARERIDGLGYALVRWSLEVLNLDSVELGLRLAPAVAGWLAIPLTYFAFKPLAGPRTSSLGALVVAISPFEIQWSQTARFYTFSQAAALLGTACFLRALFYRGALRERTRVGLALLGLGLGAFSIRFHIHGLLVPLASTVGFAVIKLSARAAANPWMVGGAAATAALSITAASPVWSKYYGQKSLSDPLSGLSHFVFSSVYWIGPVVGLLAIVSALRIRRHRDPGFRFIVAVVVAGSGTLLALSPVVKVAAQYTFSLFPWVAILACWTLDPGRGAALGRWAATLLLIGSLVLPTARYFTAEFGQRPRWREAAEFIQQNAAPSQRIFAIPQTTLEFYLLEGSDPDVRAPSLVTPIQYFGNEDLMETLRASPRGWVALRDDYFGALPGPSRKLIEEFLGERGTLRAQYPVPALGRSLRIDLWSFERDG